MKIYTKIGDKGETMLANGSRVEKSSLRIEAYGTVDELNANIAHLRDYLIKEKTSDKRMTLLISSLFRIQEELFEVGAELALAPLMKLQKHIDSESTLLLEQEIDQLWSSIPPLTNFVLPGGHLANSQAHISRCVCRRCERVLCALKELDTVRPDLLIYFNRLSDWLFAVARTIHHIFGVEEFLWKGKSSK